MKKAELETVWEEMKEKEQNVVKPHDDWTDEEEQRLQVLERELHINASGYYDSVTIENTALGQALLRESTAFTRKFKNLSNEEIENAIATLHRIKNERASNESA